MKETELLGKAGTLIANLDCFGDEDGLPIHADNYCLANFDRFLYAHRHPPRGCLKTMMIFRTDDPSSCSIVELDQRGVVVGFHEKVQSPPRNLANGAVYVLSTELLERLGKNLRSVKDFNTGVLHRLWGQACTYHIAEVFFDAGTPEAYEAAND